MRSGRDLRFAGSPGRFTSEVPSESVMLRRGPLQAPRSGLLLAAVLQTKGLHQYSERPPGHTIPSGKCMVGVTTIRVVQATGVARKIHLRGEILNTMCLGFRTLHRAQGRGESKEAIVSSVLKIV